MRSFWFFFTWILCFTSYAQQDTSYLVFDQLHWSDISLNNDQLAETKIVAGTRSERALGDLPFSVFVITADEIKEQGFFTLVDAIKHLPGIRVSQPGSAIDGETFMIRGLYGNAYTKILIDGTPIKPSVVGGMPIGSQLPIRQAERIEVIYGPAATLYGTDAASGVINIILKDSEYPTYAQADIETGLQDLTRLTAMFGGKFPMGKKTLKLKMYGGFTSFSDRLTIYDLDSLYNPDIYENINEFDNDPQDLIRYEDRPNYVGSSGTPVISNLPHQSSYIGFSASIGAFEFNTQRLFRSDHSSIGLNPYAVSYADPQTQIGEEILTSSISFRKKYDKWSFLIKGSNLAYKINPLSSFKYVLPTFGLITNIFYQNNKPDNPTFDGRNRIDSLYLSGPRYVSNKTTDLSIDLQVNFDINNNINLSAGLQSLGGFGDAIEYFRALPGVVEDRFIQSPLFPGSDVNFSEISAFTEGYLTYSDFQAILGTQIFFRSDENLYKKAEFSPRAGLLYRPSPKFSIRASYSSAFKYPSSFYSGSTYKAFVKDDFIGIESGSIALEPEKIISIESGIRFLPHRNFRLDASIYYTRTKNYINYDFKPQFEEGTILWGYQNDSLAFSELRGIQLNIQMIDIWEPIKLGADISISYSRGKEKIPTFLLNLIEEPGIGVQDLPVIRAQPDFIGHVRLSFEVSKYVKIFLNNSFMTKSWTKNILRISAAPPEERRNFLFNSGYYTLEVKALFKISRQLNAYINLSNLFNTQYAGIDAGFNPDILLYNPQPLRSLNLGVNFAFN